MVVTTRSFCFHSFDYVQDVLVGDEYIEEYRCIKCGEVEYVNYE